MKAGAKRKYPQKLVDAAKRMKKTGKYSIRSIERFLGFPCGVLRYYLKPGERARVAKATRSWAKRNPEKKAAIDKKWRDDNPEKWKEMVRATHQRRYWSMSKAERRKYNRKHYLQWKKRSTKNK